MSSWTFIGILSCVIDCSSLNMPSSVTVLRLLYLRHRSEIFHSFTVLSGGIRGRKERGKMERKEGVRERGGKGGGKILKQELMDHTNPQWKVIGARAYLIHTCNHINNMSSCRSTCTRVALLIQLPPLVSMAIKDCVICIPPTASC